MIGISKSLIVEVKSDVFEHLKKRKTPAFLTKYYILLINI